MRNMFSEGHVRRTYYFSVRVSSSHVFETNFHERLCNIGYESWFPVVKAARYSEHSVFTHRLVTDGQTDGRMAPPFSQLSATEITSISIIEVSK